MSSFLKAVLVVSFLLLAPMLSVASPIVFETEDGIEISADIEHPCLLYTSPSPRDRG